MTEMPHSIIVTATRQGTSEDNADCAAVYYLPDTDTSAAALVDGIGHGAGVVALSYLAAQVAARVGVRKTSVLGILAAAELVAAPGAGRIEPDAVAVLAITRPGGHETSIAWTGDCRAYGWDGTHLVQRTTDHTVGQYLRINGVALDLAKDHDNWIRTSLGRTTIATVHQAYITDPLILLTSDGVHDQMTHDTLEDLVREYCDDPQTLADAIVNAAENGPAENDQDYRDDATTIVIQTTPHHGE